MKGETGTFSILALSENPKLIGVAVASGSIAVGSRVPHVKPGVGVVATQAYTNIAYGTEGLRLMKMGFWPKEALNKFLEEDSEREQRQVAIMDFAGRKAVFTGYKAPEWRGDIVGEGYVVIGNFLKNDGVLKSMALKFESSCGDLAFKLLDALKAGSISGGDKRGVKSAALIVADSRNVLLRLKVDMHENPVEELLHQLETGAK